MSILFPIDSGDPAAWNYRDYNKNHMQQALNSVIMFNLWRYFLMILTD